MSICKFITQPRNWVLLFVFLCQLVFASPELILLGMSIAVGWLYCRQRLQSVSSSLMRADPRAFWLVPLCFGSVFLVKLLSATWALHPKEAIDNAFNHIHFLLWPSVMVFIIRAKVSPRKAEPWIVASMILLMFWYLAARLFFPFSEDATCFKAGGHNCGLLGHTLSLMLLWLFIAVTRPESRGLQRVLLLVGLATGWVAFLGTVRRTEMLGLLVGMLVVLVWRFKLTLFMKKARIVLGICLALLIMAWSVMWPRFAVVNHEVNLYLQGGQSRVQALDTSVGARLEMYRIAFEAIQARPLWVGVQGSSLAMCLNLQPNLHNRTDSAIFTSNIYR
jgi:hypothetical protein